MALDLLIRILARGGNEASAQIEKPTKAAKDLEGAMSRVDKASGTTWSAINRLGSSPGFTRLAANAKRYQAAVKEAQQETEGLTTALEKTRGVGMGLMVAGGAMAALGAKAIQSAAGIEAQTATLTSLTGSADKAAKTMDYLSRRSTQSIFSRSELTEAGTLLTAYQMDVQRFLPLSDDLAAAFKSQGATIQDTARAMGRLASGDFGEAFERLRDFGISRKDLEGQGLEFDKSGQYAGSVEAALAAVEKIIKERFNGISGTLATTTLQGSFSNFGDAVERLGGTMGSVWVPVVGAATSKVTALTNALNDAHPAISGTASVLYGIVAVGTTVGDTLMTLAGQVGMATLGMRAMGIEGPLSFKIVGNAVRAMSKTSVESLTPMLLIIGKIALVALAAAAAIYLVDKALHWKEDKELQSNIAAGDSTDPARLEMSNKQRRWRGLAAETMEQFKAREADDDGTPSGAPLDPTSQIANIQSMLQSANAVPLVARVAGAVEVNESEDGEEAPAAKATTKESKAAARELQRLARRDEKHRREQVREKTRQEKALARIAKAQAKRADKLEEFAADVLRAQLEEETETAIARLETFKTKNGDNSGIERQIEQIKAQKLIREAEIQARTMGDDDPQRAQSILQVARIRAQGVMNRAALAKGKDPFQRFRNGDLGLPRGRGGGAALSMAASANATTPYMQAGNYGEGGPMTNTNVIPWGAPMASLDSQQIRPHPRAPKARGRGSVSTNAAGQQVMKIVFDTIEMILPRDELSHEMGGW
jgi:hypothetical protein